MQNKLIFQDRAEDFVKIFLSTILVFFLIQLPGFISTPFFILLTVYFLDGGHVYSTLLEVLFDSTENKKKYVAIVLLGTFFLNFFIHFFFESLFFYYIFYFTIFHNMRQGLGITFLYRAGNSPSPSLIKAFYYFLTLVPFFIFHLKDPILGSQLSSEILMPFYLGSYLKNLLPQFSLNILTYFYACSSVLIFTYLQLTKNNKGALAMFFFGVIYAYAFIFSSDYLKSYVLLIFSHAIPYFFLMEKRVKLTHQTTYIRKFAWVFLLLLFAFGGAIDYFQDDVIDYFLPFKSLTLALLTTPLISHFIFDAIIWKRGNARFKSFMTNEKYEVGGVNV